jgi:hypothetical protein
MDEAPKVLDPALRPAVIDSTFRNGSLAVMSVVGGFSLGFLSRWAGLPGPWTPTDLFAVAAITLGIVLQVKALADMLSVKSLLLEHYNRTVRIFFAGLVLVFVGVAAAIFTDLIGLGGSVLKS